MLRNALAAALYSIALDADHNPTLDLTDTAERILADPAFKEALIDTVAEAMDYLPVPSEVYDWWIWTRYDAANIVEHMLGADK